MSSGACSCPDATVVLADMVVMQHTVAASQSCVHQHRPVAAFVWMAMTQRKLAMVGEIDSLCVRLSSSIL